MKQSVRVDRGLPCYCGKFCRVADTGDIVENNVTNKR